MTEGGGVPAGIENDIKIWSPLAEKASPPGAAAEELMSRNRSQAARESPGRVSQVMLTPHIIAQLMRLQSMHQQSSQVPRYPPHLSSCLAQANFLHDFGFECYACMLG